MVKLNAVAAVVDRNFRRDKRNDLFMDGPRGFMTWIPSSGKIQLGQFGFALSLLRRVPTTIARRNAAKLSNRLQSSMSAVCCSLQPNRTGATGARIVHG
jgi:hypothetical protein